MYEIMDFLRQKRNLSTAIQQVNFPVYQGKPNSVHGKYFMVGSVPTDCYKKYYDTEAQAIEAAQAAGAERIQRIDCSFV